MRLWFSLFVVMAFVSQAYCPEKEDMGHVQEIIPGQVYAGASRAKSGEPVYFGQISSLIYIIRRWGF